MAAGQPADRFWDQTPATHSAIMKGFELAMRRQMELAMFTAWHTAHMSSFSKQLPSLSDLLKQLDPPAPKRQQTPDEILATMRAIRQATQSIDRRLQ